VSDGGATPIERPWAEPTDIENVWRPLTEAERDRATNLIDSIERGILREWPAVPGRLLAETLSVEDVRDVVVWSVMPVLGVDMEIPVNAKAYQEPSGSESRSITLGGALGGTWMEFAPWMVRVFEGGAGSSRPRGPVSRFNAPPAGDLARVGFLGAHRAAHGSPGAER
jgi:hypothetical protein